MKGRAREGSQDDHNLGVVLECSNFVRPSVSAFFTLSLTHKHLSKFRFHSFSGICNCNDQMFERGRVFAPHTLSPTLSHSRNGTCTTHTQPCCKLLDGWWWPIKYKCIENVHSQLALLSRYHLYNCYGSSVAGKFKFFMATIGAPSLLPFLAPLQQWLEYFGNLQEYWLITGTGLQFSIWPLV